MSERSGGNFRGNKTEQLEIMYRQDRSSRSVSVDYDDYDLTEPPFVSVKPISGDQKPEVRFKRITDLNAGSILPSQNTTPDSTE